MPVRVTMAAWIGSSNAGDELIHAALRRKLRARGVDVTVITADPGAARSSGAVGVGHLDAIGIARAIRADDALIVGGGGLLQDHTSACNLPHHLSRPAWARAVATPHAAVGVGAGPVRTRLGGTQVRHALGGAVGISARDQGSVDLLRGLGLRGVRLAADLALSLPSPPTAADDWITACLRPWRTTRSRLPVAIRSWRDTTPDDMVARLAHGLDDAARRLGLPVRLVAMQPGRDDMVHRRVAARMRAPVTVVSPPPREVLRVLAASRVVVAMRYHAAVGALLAGRPIAVVACDAKLMRLARDIGPGATQLPWTRAALAHLGETISGVVAHDEHLPAALARLRTRERVNDAILDVLLERTAHTA
jgi:polysaccharide pyruvyl transferase CsaB